jgi:hypothetical protein
MLRRPGAANVDDRLDVAYDDPYEMIWSLQSLTTGAVVAMSGF